MPRLTIERMTYGPEAIAHDDDGKTVFVSGAIPGDVVEASVVSDERRFSRAVVDQLVEPSPWRVEAPCPYADFCGGCPWAQLAEQAQLEAKRANVVDALVRVGHLAPERAQELVGPAERPSAAWGYRNKVELASTTVRGRVTLGMHAMGDTEILRVDRCLLLDKRHGGLTRSVAGALSYLANSHHIQVERVGIRASSRTRDVEVALWTPTGAFPRAQVAKVLKDATKASSIVRVLTKGPAKTRRVTGVERLSGKGFWTERVAGGRMDLSAPSFFQVSTAGAERLVDLVLEGLRPTGDDEAMDLYCGAGTFTLPLARACAYVSAVESAGPAVRDLRRNLEKSGLDNVEPIGGDAGREFPETESDVIVVDPPRAGLASEVVGLLSRQQARAIAYVSCDPATLARDLARFADEASFEPIHVSVVDLFPQTYHVETVTILVRR